MKSLTKQKLLLATLALTLWQLPAFARAAAPDAGVTFPDPVIASGKGFEIKRSQLDDAFASYSATIAANGQSIPATERSDIRGKLLQHLIINSILTQKATADDKAKIKKMVDDDIALARKSAPSPEAFDQQIKASGMTLDQVRQRACEEQLAKLVLQRETTNGITVTDDAAKKFYDDNPTDFERPEQVRVTHILISTLDPTTQRPLPADQKKAKEKLATDIRNRAVKGEDWGKLVKEYSEDPGSKNKGGEYTFGRKRMVPEFEAAAFSLKTNQISDLVETQYGYHIIKLLEKFPAKHEQYAEVQPKIKEYLAEKQAQTKLPAYIDKLEKDANVKTVAQDDIKSEPILPVTPSAK